MINMCYLSEKVWYFVETKCLVSNTWTLNWNISKRISLCHVRIRRNLVGIRGLDTWGQVRDSRTFWSRHAYQLTCSARGKPQVHDPSFHYGAGCSLSYKQFWSLRTETSSPWQKETQVSGQDPSSPFQSPGRPSCLCRVDKINWLMMNWNPIVCSPPLSS